MRALLVVLVFAGCSKKAADDGPKCPEVVDHMVEVMKAGLKGHDSVNLGDRKQMIDQCENRKMTAKERRCLRDAKDLAGLASCRLAKATPPPDPMPTRPVVPPLPAAVPETTGSAPAPPAAAGSGG